MKVPEAPILKFDPVVSVIAKSQYAQETRRVFGFDSETHSFSVGDLAPRLVCLTTAHCPTGSLSGSDLICEISGRAEASGLEDMLAFLFNPEQTISGAQDQPETFLRVGHNTAFDLAVVCRNFPELIPSVFECLKRGLIVCTKVREKLIDLTTTGDLDYRTLPSGEKEKAAYHLANLVRNYFHLNIESSKKETDAWRTNYAVLDGVPLSDWPAEAKEYAIQDSVYAQAIFWRQEELRHQIYERTGIDPLQTQGFRTSVDFALYLMSMQGVCVDADKAREIEAMLTEELSPDKTPLLIQSGILIPAQPARPYAKGAQSHYEGCKKKWKDPETGKQVCCNCPPKMTAPVEESISQAKLRDHVVNLAKNRPELEIEVRYTAPSDKFPEGQVQVNAEFLEDYADLDDLLSEYAHRQSLQKLVTTEIPRMKKDDGTYSPVVHPCFDVLKTSGRSSSFASKAYPSFNCQNVDPRARECYVSRPGYVLLSVDLKQMELGGFAQTCLNLFGYSVMAQKINAGYDLHAFLGAQIAVISDADFANYVISDRKALDHDSQYLAFLEMADKSAGPEGNKFFKHFRKLAKPTGLGYPGGLGPEKFVKYAKATYGEVITLETAKMLRDAWRQTFPEAVDYFKYINQECLDPFNEPSLSEDKATGKVRRNTKYAYRSPMGMYRAGANYCAACNGLGLQTPTAEGILLAGLRIMAAAYDWSTPTILSADDKGRPCIPLMEIHDEYVFEIREDDRITERALYICGIMEASMREITPDVRVTAQPSLMRRWNKNAEPVWDSAGNLKIWEPEKKETV